MLRQWRSYSDMKSYIIEQIRLTERGCWEWPTGHRSGGYAEITIKGRKRRLHRVSYEEFKGAIPEGKSVCHHCDNPRCVNPDHLYAGTAKDNARDVNERGRPGNSRLEKGDVEEIKRLYQEGASGQEIALRYGVGVQSIRNIVYNRTWIGIGPDVSGIRAVRVSSPPAIPPEQLREIGALLGKMRVEDIAKRFGVKEWRIYEFRAKEIKGGRLPRAYTSVRRPGSGRKKASVPPSPGLMTRAQDSRQKAPHAFS